MRKTRQETREEKICRQIRNVTGTLEREPTLRSLRERKAELEVELRNMPLEKRQELVPWEETAREAKENIATLDEFIEKARTELAELRTCRARLVRETKVAEAQIKKSKRRA